MGIFLDLVVAFLFLSQVHSAPQPTSNAAGSSTTQPDTALVTQTSGSKTWVETFSAYSLSQYASSTGTETVTTTDANGAALVGLVFPLGLAWFGVIPPGAPPSPPKTPPPKTVTRELETTKTSQ